MNSAATTEVERDLTESARHTISSFRSMTWRPYLSDLRNGAILVDVPSRALTSGTKRVTLSDVGADERGSDTQLPDNPLGTHGLYLGWHYYRNHGTHDTRKIGRRSSDGCIGQFNEHIA